MHQVALQEAQVQEAVRMMPEGELVEMVLREMRIQEVVPIRELPLIANRKVILLLNEKGVVLMLRLIANPTK
jgi:hypothetical protein